MNNRGRIFILWLLAQRTDEIPGPAGHDEREKRLQSVDGSCLPSSSSGAGEDWDTKWQLPPSQRGPNEDGVSRPERCRGAVFGLDSDHLGGFVCRLDWRGDGWKAAFQRDVPYEDGSGMLGIQNWPDGVYTFWFGSDDKDRWVSDILYEFQYTKKQSGTYESRPTTPEEQAHLDPKDEYHYYYHVYGGLDNYFNGAYSGWTHYGRTIGNPLMSPKGTHDATWTSHAGALAPSIENNRLKAHHLSLSGRAFHKLPYKLMLTYSQNYGTYQNPYIAPSQIYEPWGTVPETPLHQISAALVGELPFASLGLLSSQSPQSPRSFLRHLTLTYGFFADRGQLLPDAFGVSVGVRWEWKVR